jgi:hypothetical protein
MPPAIRHAHHGGGDRDHGHDAVAKHDLDHGHHHDHEGADHRHDDLDHGHHHDHEGADHRHDDADVTAPTLLGDFVVHLHWKLFGLDFCTPVRQEDEHDEDGGASKLALIWLVKELPTVISGGDHSQVAPLVAPPVPGPRLVVAKASPSHPPNPVTSIPLCDSARLERSGVLLA